MSAFSSRRSARRWCSTSGPQHRTRLQMQWTEINDRPSRAMAPAPLRLAPQPPLWNAWLGFNLSHSLGLLVFGTVFGAMAVSDFGAVVENLFLRFGAVLVGLIYLLLALRFWFWVPAVLS